MSSSFRDIRLVALFIGWPTYLIECTSSRHTTTCNTNDYWWNCNCMGSQSWGGGQGGGGRTLPPPAPYLPPLAPSSPFWSGARKKILFFLHLPPFLSPLSLLSSPSPSSPSSLPLFFPSRPSSPLPLTLPAPSIMIDPRAFLNRPHTQCCNQRPIIISNYLFVGSSLG